MAKWNYMITYKGSHNSAVQCDHFTDQQLDHFQNLL